MIDAGANIGVFTLWAAANVGEQGTVVAFEPNPLAFRVLTDNVRTLPQVTANQLACSDQPTTMTLHFPPGRLSVGSFDERPDRTQSAQVSVVTLDAALDSVHGEIALLKIDVEGHEVPVLNGAARTMQRTRRLALEVSGDDLPACEAIINAAGLSRVSLTSGMWNLPERRGVVAHFVRDAA
ncbi:FkbM family methyltransferase [uncultured Jatrophihabitans sp.]|uniref:FkbM family methyltransferase n=1 Tax=uncultured Jatrophihabitans sp. TaxID=1610747 RepID=UPI0035CB7F40